jgi:hypothetical protein
MVFPWANPMGKPHGQTPWANPMVSAARDPHQGATGANRDGAKHGAKSHAQHQRLSSFRRYTVYHIFRPRGEALFQLPASFFVSSWGPGVSKETPSYTSTRLQDTCAAFLVNISEKIKRTQVSRLYITFFDHCLTFFPST